MAVKRVCRACGITFFVRDSQARVGEGVYCSRACHVLGAAAAAAARLEGRFYEKVTKSSGCWLWNASLNRWGYGSFGWQGRKQAAHRVAYELANGSIPDGLSVLHTCDNPSCVRNDDVGWYEVNGVLHPRRGHLWLGTQRDNMEDMSAKGRSTTGDRSSWRKHPELVARGSRVAAAKLTEEQVREIRRRLRDGDNGLSQIATEYGVSRSNVECIRDRKSWRHVQ